MSIRHLTTIEASYRRLVPGNLGPQEVASVTARDILVTARQHVAEAEDPLDIRFMQIPSENLLAS